MFCTKCGKELEENEMFCTGCGAETTAEPQQADGLDELAGEIRQAEQENSDEGAGIEEELGKIQDGLEQEADLLLCESDSIAGMPGDETGNPVERTDVDTAEQQPDGEADEAEQWPDGEDGAEDTAPAELGSSCEPRAKSSWSPVIIGITTVAVAAVTILSAYFVVISGREYTPVSFTAETGESGESTAAESSSEDAASVAETDSAQQSASE